MWINPSIYAHIMSGAILFLTIFVAIFYKVGYQTLGFMLLVSIALALHGISHLGLEYVYGYNPVSVLYKLSAVQ
jgi:hypothetical protein